MTGMRLEERWPDLFEGLDEEQHASVVAACASIWHEGWEPNREDLALLVLYVRGDISAEEHMRRSLELAGVDTSTAPLVQA